MKLLSMQMQALGGGYPLEQLCGGQSAFQTNEKTINMLINLILPLCVRMGCGRRGTTGWRAAAAMSALLRATNSQKQAVVAEVALGYNTSIFTKVG